MRGMRKLLLKNETDKLAGIRDRGLRRSHRKQKAKPIRIETHAAAEGRGRGSRRSYPKASGKRKWPACAAGGSRCLRTKPAKQPEFAIAAHAAPTKSRKRSRSASKRMQQPEVVVAAHAAPTEGRGKGGSEAIPPSAGEVRGRGLRRSYPKAQRKAEQEQSLPSPKEKPRHSAGLFRTSRL